MFNNDDQTASQPTQAPTLGGAPMSGVSDAADTTVSPVSPVAGSGGSVGGPPIVSPAYPTTQPTVSPTVPVGNDELMAIKQQALTQLSPLVDKLDQTPEEKFRLTMTMIQASDDHSLVKTAYEAAEKITDEKARAEALLSIVNEVNYFSQKAAGRKPGEETPAL